MLIDYISKTEHQIVFPDIVFKEILALYKRILIEKFGQMIKSYDDLKINLAEPVEYEKPALEVETQLKSFEENLKKRLNIYDKNIVSIKNSYLPDLVNRAINRIPPFLENKAEFRDALIWLTILDQADLAKEKSIAFISANTKEFAEKEDTLHPKLLEEARARGVIIEYYSSLDSFLKSKASKIEFITEEWIKRELDLETLSNKLITMLKTPHLWHGGIEGLKYGAKVLSGPDVQVLSIIQSVNTWILDYYVYEMADESIRVEMMLGSELEVEYMSHEVGEDSRVLYQDVFDEAPVNKRKFLKVSYPTVEFEAHLIIKEEKIESAEIIDWWV
jgi:hypothetical protein